MIIKKQIDKIKEEKGIREVMTMTILFKIILFPISLTLSFIYTAYGVVLKIVSYILGPIMLLAFIGGISAFFMLNKITGLIFCGIGLAIIVLPNLLSMLVGLLDDLNGCIKNYMRR